jgi:hypothetical protein
LIRNIVNAVNAAIPKRTQTELSIFISIFVFFVLEYPKMHEKWGLESLYWTDEVDEERGT